ncbi:unnamed protein product [Lathyrus oleraceus]
MTYISDLVRSWPRSIGLYVASCFHTAEYSWVHVTICLAILIPCHDFICYDLDLCFASCSCRSLGQCIVTSSLDFLTIMYKRQEPKGQGSKFDLKIRIRTRT